MKKYVVLAWDQYYPSGGLGNVVADYDDLEEAKAHKLGDYGPYDYMEIADRDTWEIVWERPDEDE